MLAALRPWRRFWAGPWSRRDGAGGAWFPLEVFVLGLLLVDPEGFQRRANEGN